MKSKFITVSIIFLIVAALFFGIFVTGSTVGVSVLEAVLVAMEDEPLAEEEPEEPEDPEEPDPPEILDIPTNTGVDPDLYAKLCSMKWNEIPADENIATSLLKYPADWFAISYAYAYYLAAEICLRPEINPPGSDVVIPPEVLLGKWFMEKNFVNIPNKQNSYLTWSADDYTSGEAIGAYAMYRILYENPITGAALYIPKIENPDLPDEKRAVVGNYEAFYDESSDLKYCNEKLYSDGFDSLPSANIVDVAASIGEDNSYLTLGENAGLGSRPSVAYLPDAMYTTALAVRLGLEGRTLDHITRGGCSFPSLKSIKTLPAGNSTVRSYCSIALSLAQFAGTPYTNAAEKGSSIYNMCVSLINSNISPIITSSFGNTLSAAATELIGGPGNFCRWIFTGSTAYKDPSKPTIDTFVTALNSFNPDVHHALDPFIKNSDNTAFSKVTPSTSLIVQGLGGPGASPSSESINKWYTDFVNPANLLTASGSEDGCDTYPLTGFGVINAGSILYENCKIVINELFERYGDKTIYSQVLDENPDAVDGLKCLGKDCWCQYSKKVYTVRQYYSLPSGGDVKGVEDHISEFHQSPAVTIDSVRDKLNNLTHKMKTSSNASISYFTNLALPVMEPGGETPYSIFFGTYPEHSNNGVDLHLYNSSNEKTTVGSEIHALAEGVVVAMYCYPVKAYNTTSVDAVLGLFGQGSAAAATYPYIGYGNNIWVASLDEQGELYYTMYGHLTDFGHIKPGCVVQQGAYLGHTGTTGASTGYHPHIEIHHVTAGRFNSNSSENLGYLQTVASYLYESEKCLKELSKRTYPCDYYIQVKEGENGTWEYMSSGTW